MAESAPRFSALALRAFELWFRPFQQLRLRTVVRIDTSPLPADRPVVLVSNHVSWWDGFLLRDVHRRIAPDTPLFTLMLARELERHPGFRRLGALPLGSRPASLRAALRALEARRARAPNFTVSWFPQGEIRPSWARPLAFRRGVELLLERLAPCLVVPVALHIEPLNALRPTAFVHAGEAVSGAGLPDVGALEQAVEALLDRVLASIAGGARVAGVPSLDRAAIR